MIISGYTKTPHYIEEKTHNMIDIKIYINIFLKSIDKLYIKIYNNINNKQQGTAPNQVQTRDEPKRRR